MKWKDRLLSSSIPLEYEAAKVLSKSNFAINFDYSYIRLDNKLEKEFSIDIKAGGYYPFNINSSIKIEVDLLIECKYRNPNVSWLFIEDVNIDEFSNFSSKGVIKMIDEFSEYTIENGDFNLSNLKTCLKGIEINTQNGEVHDTGINHGINQLTYCLPSLLKQHLFGSLVGHLEDNHPYIICPILVTTADLRVLNQKFSIENLTKSESLEDISEEVPYLKFYSDVYPSFKEHCRNTFKNLLESDTDSRYEYFQELRKNDLDSLNLSKLENFISDPRSFLTDIQNSFSNDLFRETLICNFKYFPALLKEIRNIISVNGKKMKKIKFERDK